MFDRKWKIVKEEKVKDKVSRLLYFKYGDVNVKNLIFLQEKN